MNAKWVLQEKGDLSEIELYTLSLSQVVNFMESSKRDDLPSDAGTNSINPFSAKAWIAKAREANDNKNYDDAIKYLNKYINAYPSNTEVLLELSNTFYNNGQYDEAIKSYEKTIDRLEKEKEENKTHRILVANALKGKGNALVAKSNYEEALKLYNKAIIEGKNSEIINDVLYNEAIVHYKLKNYKKADEIFEEVTHNNRNDELAWRGKAAALEKLGKKSKARDALIESMKHAGLKLKKLSIR